MKILAICAILGAVALGVGDGDCTGAVGIALLSLPVLGERRSRCQK